METILVVDDEDDVRSLVRDILEQKPYQEKAAVGNFSFLRTNAFYERCMELAQKNWKWDRRRLK